MSKITITTPIALTQTDVASIKQALNITSSDEVSISHDPSLIAGMVVTKDGKTIDLSVKRKLSEISRE